jgi:ADP-ribose pyrophosphatase
MNHTEGLLMTDKKLYTEETALLPHKLEHKGIVYEDKFKKIEKICAQFDGFNKEYFVSDYGRRSAVVVIDKGCVLLARQYRLLINGLSYEIPGGKVNEQEAPQEACVRECIEETGIRCRDLKPLIEYDPDLEYTKNHTHVFHARYDETVSQNDKHYVFKPLNECLDMIHARTITDSISIISILAYNAGIHNVHQKKSEAL